MPKTDTPLTDAEAYDVGTGDMWVPADLARRLERERAELIEALKMCEGCDLWYRSNCGDESSPYVMEIVRPLLARLKDGK